MPWGGREASKKDEKRGLGESKWRPQEASKIYEKGDLGAQKVPRGIPKHEKNEDLFLKRFRMLSRVLTREVFLPIWVDFGVILDQKIHPKSVPKSMTFLM